MKPLALLLTGLALAAPVQADDLAVLCDEFDSASTVTNWSRVHQTEGWNADQLLTFDINTSQPSYMRMVPFASSWFQDYRGELTFKNVTGDFVTTTHAQVTNRVGSGAPNTTFSAGGLLVRAPRNITPATWTPGGENSVFISLGSADRAGSYQYEAKSTLNSVSTLAFTPANVYQAQLQIARIGPVVILLRRSLGGVWVVHSRIRRPDLPATLQAGLMCGTDFTTASSFTPFLHNSSTIVSGNPDVDARFEYCRYRRPVVPVALNGLDLANPDQVSDQDLLAFLGDNADDAQVLQPGTLAFTSTGTSVGESAGTVTLTVNRTGGSNGAVSVSFSTADGSAKQPGDYTTTTGSLDFADGETSKSISVPISNDGALEAAENFTVTLTSPTNGATIGPASSINITVFDDDFVPALSVNSPPAVNEGSALAPGSITFTVTLSGQLAQTVRVTYATANGATNGAIAGLDYTARTNTLTFTPGETTKTVTISLLGDAIAEANEKFFLNLTSPSNATIAVSKGSAYIRNDDGPNITIASPKAVNEGNTGTTPQVFTVSLSAASSNTVTVNFATANGTAGPADFAAQTGTLTFAPGQTSKTIAILVTGDTDVEANEKYFVNLTSPTFAIVTGSQASGYIRNDDTAAPLTAAEEPSQ